MLIPKIRETIKERMIPEIYENVRIEASGLSINPTLLGAAAIATDRVLERPSEYLSFS